MNNGYKIRALITLASLMAYVCILVVYIFMIQVVNHAYYATLGQRQYHMTITSYPPRAPIFDRVGTVVATNKEFTSAFIGPRTMKNSDETIAFLEKYYPAAAERLAAHPDVHFLYVKRRLTPQDLELIAQHPDADIRLLNEPGRTYPYAYMTNVIGKTDMDTVGQAGLELLYNQQLAGSPSTYLVEKDARSGNYYFNKRTEQSGNDGVPLHTTLDSKLQFLVTHELEHTMKEFNSREGMALILNPTTGEIIVMTQAPYTRDAPEKNWCVTETYEFGSVMKAFLALAALEEGLFTLDSIIDCENKKEGYVNGMKLSTWKAHGLLSFSEVIELSNNFGTAKIAQAIGRPLYDNYKKCGFGSPTGLTFPGQQNGFVSHPSKWSKASLNSLSFGYEARLSLLQLVRAFGLFSTGGRLVKPRILKTDKPELSEPLFKPEAIEAMRDILEKTCSQGTAHAAHIAGVTVLGKTGTARLLDETGHYSKEKTLYTFMGIVEKGDYKRVIGVSIKESNRHDLYASSIAAPLFERIAQKMLIHDKQI